MADKEKQATLSQMVYETMMSLRNCEQFADEHKLSFSWEPFYGGGGYYEGDPDERSNDYGDNDGWSSSSSGC